MSVGVRSWLAVALQVGLWSALALLAWPDQLAVVATPWVATFASFGFAGLFLVVRRPEHAVGWLMLTLGVMCSIGVGGVLLAGRFIAGGAPTTGAWADAVGNATMTAGMMAVPAILIVFPDGSIPRRFGVPLLWLTGLTAAFGAGAALLNGGWGGDPSQALVPSPLQEATAPAGDATAQVFYILLAASMFGTSAAVLDRWRRATGLERQQIKWLALGAALTVVAMAAVGFNTSDGWEVVVAATAFSTIPVAIVAAVLRYRLYEIDRIISRTVSYAVVVALLGAVFAAAVVGVPNWIPGIDDSPLFVAVGTLAVAALFNPLRKRVRAWVDRRFNRSRYDAERVITRFTGSLQEGVDADDLVVGWQNVVVDTMQPSSVGIWVRS